ncbi:hypothetical protein VB735_20305 [Halotia wernerae UHCC 0503]|nr:hypothetical protein [Halotia wernerae UHCC 0503]
MKYPVLCPAPFALIGDVMLDRGVNEEIKRRPPESFGGDVLPILQGADTEEIS